MKSPYIDKAQLQALCPKRPTTRFAPSPTGHLHLGHVLSLLYVYTTVQLTDGTLLLRIEDHDRSRCHNDYEASILADIDWLGITPTNIEAFSSGTTPYRQSNNSDTYIAVIANFNKDKLLYRCSCSRKEIATSAFEVTQELHYPGYCRKKALPPEENTGLRIAISNDTVSFDDILFGKQQQHPQSQCGDILLQARDGNYTYNFTVAVDDLAQDIDLIVRGTDLLHCTGRQRILQKIQGGSREICYLHHPILCDTTGRKLGKRHYSDGIIKRREAGEASEIAIGEALWRGGLLRNNRPVTLEEVPDIITGDHNDCC